mgnify:CR=1 FL=1|jgi:hypothetical protein
MKTRGWLILVAIALLAPPASAQVTGIYLESRTADVYTGPCFANGEVNLTGYEAVLAWRIEKGSWNQVALDGLSVVAVVRASSTLGDPFGNPLPAKTVFLVDERAQAAQHTALIEFAQAQTGELLKDVVAVETTKIQFQMEKERHGFATLEAGNLAGISTRGIGSGDHLCNNEEVFYPPLAGGLSHAMPAVALESWYRGNHLNVTWNESGRRSAFVGAFSF